MERSRERAAPERNIFLSVPTHIYYIKDGKVVKLPAFHSYRRATIGSTRDARHAGRNPAASPAIVSIAVAAPTVPRSVPVTPKSMEDTNFEQAHATGIPIATPAR